MGEVANILPFVLAIIGTTVVFLVVKSNTR